MSRVPLEIGELDLTHGVVRRADGVKQLTLHQLDLVRYLVARPHQTVPRDELLREAWGWRGAVVRSRAADFAVLRIRACIERDAKHPRHLLADAGVGYRFEPLGAAEAPELQPPGAGFDPRWYVARPEAEREAAQRLGVSGAPLVFTAPRGFGKTWSLAHALRAEVTPADAGVELDLDACDAPTLASTDAFAEHLGLSLAEALDGDADARFAAAWAASGTPFHRLSRMLEQVLLPEVPRLFLVIDHADRLRRTPGGATLFGLLRAWASRSRAPWDRLRLVLAVSTEPALIVDDAISPFNLSVPIALGPFDRAAIEALVARHGLAPTWAEPVWSWTRGHPTLARIACYAASRGTLAPDGFDQDGGVFDDPLRSRLVRLQARPELADAIRAVLAGAAPPSGPAERLVAAGLLVRTRAGYELQNPLTAAFLARWL
ncbi:MAG: AAA-like domain-containing protein [Myxococcota bacterium]